MRGDVYRLKSPKGVMGREQSGARYAIVVKADELFSSTTIVVPTSQSARMMDHRPIIIVESETTNVLVEQIMAVDPVRLGDLVGHLSLSEMREIDVALRTVLDL